MRSASIPLLSSLALLALAAVAPAQNIVQNPGFEVSTPGFDGYFQIGSPFQTTGFTPLDEPPVLPSEGALFALFGFQNGSDGLSQVLATNAGAAYTLGFDLKVVGAHNVPSPTQSILVTFGGVPVLSLSNSPAGAYIHYSLPVTATSNSDVLTFQSSTSFNGVYALDNLSVTPVPEPASLAVLGLGAAFALRRRTKA